MGDPLNRREEEILAMTAFDNLIEAWQRLLDESKGHKIFVSYKFKDDDVYRLSRVPLYEATTVRDYVNEFEDKLDKSDHIYKGEQDDEDLSDLSDETIWEKLKDRIYDSSVTVVFISPGMKEDGVAERDQWIPWEISYSLKETTRKTETGKSVTSHTNAMIAVVLPDSRNSYQYYFDERSCCSQSCTLYNQDRLFRIMKKNMFNLKNAQIRNCIIDSNKIWYGEHSYIKAVRWNDFITDYNKHINEALERQNRLDDYDITKDL